MKKCLFILVLSLFIFSNNIFAASSNPYDITAYDIDIVVKDDNSLYITENIDVFFNVARHGIFRTIPTKNEVKRLDGTTYTNRANISQMKISDNYSTSSSIGSIEYKIGDEDVTIKGDKSYTLSYRYKINGDGSKEYDELYFNIIGTGWDTTIDNVTFKITMPKDFDTSKIGFSSGKYGSTDNENITYSVDGNIITGSYNKTLEKYNGVTIRIELPEGYFIQSIWEVYLPYLFPILSILSILICYLLWSKYGRDDEVIETVEFYPPEGYNSAEIGTMYRGFPNSTDPISLLIYLAGKGYIKIAETKEKISLLSVNSFKVTKLKDYDGDNDIERIFMQGLFIKKSEVTQSDLQDKFYVYIDKITKKLISLTKKIFEKTTIAKQQVVFLINIAVLLTNIIVPTLVFGGGIETLIFAIIFQGISLIASSLFISTVNLSFVAKLSFIVLFFLPFFAAGFFAGILPIISTSIPWIIAYAISSLCIFVNLIISSLLIKRTQFGNEMLGKIKGFKNFLETAEKDKLETLVYDDPTYFYKILPYTYVLGVSDKWIRKFESINLQSPDWYDSPNTFSNIALASFMNSTMKSVTTSMTSNPSSGGSGGGSSGGGSGGGGGGSW